MLETLPENVTYATQDESEVETTKNEREEESSSTESTIYVERENPGSLRVNAADNDVRSSFSGLDYSSLDNVWVLSINGATYNVLFPSTEDLKVVDGVLVNVGSSAITGVILGDRLSLNTYFQRTFTVLPLMGNNSQSSSYRYGAHGYITTYSPSTGQTLSQVQDYGDARVNSRGRFGSTWSSVQIIIIALLALQVLISFIGGLLRRG